MAARGGQKERSQASGGTGEPRRSRAPPKARGRPSLRTFAPDAGLAWPAAAASAGADGSPFCPSAASALASPSAASLGGGGVCFASASFFSTVWESVVRAGNQPRHFNARETRASKRQPLVSWARASSRDASSALTISSVTWREYDEERGESNLRGKETR